MAETNQDLASVVAEIRSRAAGVRLVAIDGPGGSGKSTFASQLAAAAANAPVVHTDDFASPAEPIDWWPRLLKQVIVPLSRGEQARYQRYDWPSDSLAEWHAVDPVPIVIIEGVSSARREWAEHLSYAIWIDTPRRVRLERGLERDGAAELAQWRLWMAAEDAHYQRDATTQRADLIINGAPEQIHTEPLDGGWQTAVHRDGDIIRRSSSPWSQSVMHFLDHLAQEQFAASPRRIGTGFDDEGNETLEFIPGRSLHPSPWSDQGIIELGQMLAQFHAAARTFQPPPGATWQGGQGRKLGNPATGFGHGDLGPWNIMAINGSPVGFIDWDNAGPMDPLWELAQAAWLNAQLHDDDAADLAGLGSPEDRAHQLALLLDGYQLGSADRAGFIDKMVEVAIHDAAAQAREHSVSPETTVGIAADGYPFAWGMAWRVRAASWMLRHRRLLESTIG